MKLYSWILTIVLSAVISGCGSSNNDNVLSMGSTDPALIQDRTWSLFAVQDDSGNQIQFVREPSIEYKILFSTEFVTLRNQGTFTAVMGINVCNFFSGGYTLVDGLLTIIGSGTDEGFCEPAPLPIPFIFSSVLFGSDDQTSMLSVNTEIDVLTITSGTNEALFFELSDEPLFPQ